MTELKPKGRRNVEAQMQVGFAVLQLVERGVAVDHAVSLVAVDCQVTARTVWRHWRRVPESQKATVEDRIRGRSVAVGEGGKIGLRNGRGHRQECHPHLWDWLTEHVAMGIEPSDDALHLRMIGEFSGADIYLPSRGLFGRWVAKIKEGIANAE
ncbi:MAG: hypothetical protein U1E15_06110 [Hyphomicrobiales bacterium]